MNLTIKTINSDDNNWESYIETIKQFITQSNFEDNLKHNYTIKRLNIDDWVGASTYETQSGKILGFSSVIHRKQFYGNGCRVLNRFIKSVDYRFAVNDIKYTKQMIEQQIELVDNLKFNYAFMSRETKFGANGFKHFLHNKMQWPEWIIETDQFYVCNGDSSCEQNITWLPLTKDCINIELERVKNDCRKK
jgi:hypothetical protein